MASDHPELVIIRGVPGSGKSTLARSLSQHTHVEADQFFYRLGYFDPTRLSEAHADCLNRVTKHLSEGKNVVVSNTFIKLAHLQPYLGLTPNTKIIVCEGNFKNVHNVPKYTVQRMKREFEHAHSNPAQSHS